MERNTTESSLFNTLKIVCRKALFIVGFFGFFTNLLMLTVPLYMMQVYDRVLTSHSHETLLYLTLIAIVAVFVLVWIDAIRSRILIYLSVWMDKTLSPEALRLGPDEILQGHPYGAEALRDITTVRQFIASPSIFSLLDWPYMPMYLFVIFLLHPMLGAISLIGALMLLGLAIVNEIITRRSLAEANNQSIVAQQYADHALRNAEVIQAMGMITNIVNQWSYKNEPVLQHQLAASEKAAWILSAAKFLRILLQIFILGVGAYYVTENQLTSGGMIAASILSGRALAPVEQAIAVWKQLLSARNAYQRLHNHFSKALCLVASIHLPKPQGELVMENVVMRVPNREKPLLSQISLTIHPGELVALIGPSGSGKSTLARLMVGALKPSMGHVRLDSADIFSWNRGQCGQYIGYLPQDVELFTGTVKENIARMGDVNDALVIEAAIMAGVHKTILYFPEGYNTMINSVGFSLSAGQKQRIALARALYQYPQLIVLDEPNAHLDTEGDQALKQALLQTRDRGATQIIITHRPSLVEHVDRIIILHEGRIQRMGSREEILTALQPQRVT